MKIIDEYFNGEVKVFCADIFSDERGFFQESYNLKKMQEIGIKTNFIQDNHSFSSEKGTIRGIHFQNDPMAQSKLVRVVKGSVLDVIVDLRKESSSYLKSVSVKISQENLWQIYIPKGFGHGFCTLSDDCHFLYKVDQYYSVESNCGIIWNDPTLDICWPTENPIISAQDKNWKKMTETDFKF